MKWMIGRRFLFRLFGFPLCFGNIVCEEQENILFPSGSGIESIVQTSNFSSLAGEF